MHPYVEHNVSCTGNNFDARVNVHGDWIEPFIRTADPGFLPDSVPDPGADPVDASVEDGGPASAAAPTTRIETSGGCALTPAASSGATGLAGVAALALLGLLLAHRVGVQLERAVALIGLRRQVHARVAARAGDPAVTSLAFCGETRHC